MEGLAQGSQHQAGRRRLRKLTRNSTQLSTRPERLLLGPPRLTSWGSGGRESVDAGPWWRTRASCQRLGRA